jgi:fumarylacetoacetase
MPSTTSPDLRSFVPVPPDSHFPIQNLPYGVFKRRYVTSVSRLGSALAAH